MDPVGTALRIVGTPTVLMVLACAVVVSVVIGVGLRRRGVRTSISAAGTVLSLGLVFGTTFAAGGFLEFHAFDLEYTCDGLIEDEQLDSEAILNVLLYMPLTASLVGLSRRPWLSFTIASGIAVATEFLQTAIGYGVCEEVDTLRNVLGILLVAAPIALGGRLRRLRRVRTAGRSARAGQGAGRGPEV